MKQAAFRPFQNSTAATCRSSLISLSHLSLAISRHPKKNQHMRTCALQSSPTMLCFSRVKQVIAIYCLGVYHPHAHSIPRHRRAARSGEDGAFRRHNPQNRRKLSSILHRRNQERPRPSARLQRQQIPPRGQHSHITSGKSHPESPGLTHNRSKVS